MTHPQNISEWESLPIAGELGLYSSDGPSVPDPAISLSCSSGCGALRPSYAKCFHSVFCASLKAALYSLLSITGRFVRAGKTRALCPRQTSILTQGYHENPPLYTRSHQASLGGVLGCSKP